MNKTRIYSFLSFIAGFILVGIGRIVNLSVLKSQAIVQVLPDVLSYALLAGTGFYLLAGLFFAAGNLRLTGRLLTGVVAAVIAVSLLKPVLRLYSGIGYDTFYIYAVCSAAAAASITVLILKLSPAAKRTCSIDTKKRGLSSLFKQRPLKFILETVFRLLPIPRALGLYTIGSPNPDGPIIITGNYSLTVRRTARALKGADCRLLVCSSKGINIWCSTLAGHFSDDDIIQALQIFTIAKDFPQAPLILPQLCASNVSLKKIARATSLHCSFGPVYARDIPGFLHGHKDTEMRRVIFPLQQRLEMAGGTLLLPSIFLLIVFNFFNISALAVLIPTLFGLSLLNAAVFPYRPVRNIRVWSLLYGLFGVVITFAGSLLFSNHSIIFSAAVGLVCVYLVNEFEGWSPLVKFSIRSAYRKETRIIDREKCIGCGMCIQVCPKAVFERESGTGTVIVGKPDACISCWACINRCPEHAIT